MLLSLQNEDDALSRGEHLEQLEDEGVDEITCS